jgi:hypothetical protein
MTNPCINQDVFVLAKCDGFLRGYEGSPQICQDKIN